MFTKKKILVVVAHPDDELLGLGGTINKLVNDSKAKIRVIILGEGITSRFNNDNLTPKKQLSEHHKNISEAKKHLGYDSYNLYKFPDNCFDTVPLLNIIKVIEKEILDFQPSIIFTHHENDLNIDHQITFKAVMTASRPLPNCSVNNIISFETPSSTEWIASKQISDFSPNFFISINDENLKAKQNAMDCYVYESREYPHPRSNVSLKIRAQFWGIKTGKKLAEAFYINRIIYD